MNTDVSKETSELLQRLHFAHSRTTIGAVNAAASAEEKPSVFEDYLRRAFGDEIARVSRLPLMERYR